jgi:hypothetical protein
MRDDDDKVKSALRDREFFLILKQSIVDGMKTVLGESGFQSTSYYLDLVAVFERPAQLHKKLYSLFGVGTLTLERTILTELYQRVNVPFKERKGYKFADYVYLGGRAFMANKGSSE